MQMIHIKKYRTLILYSLLSMTIFSEAKATPFSSISFINSGYSTLRAEIFCDGRFAGSCWAPVIDQGVYQCRRYNPGEPFSDSVQLRPLDKTQEFVTCDPFNAGVRYRLSISGTTICDGTVYPGRERETKVVLKNKPSGGYECYLL